MLNRIIAVVMLALLFAAAALIYMLYGSAGQVQSFTSAHSICESAYAGSCYNTGKAPVTWTMPTQNVEGAKLSCSILLVCNCTGSGSAGKHECAPAR